MNEPMILALDGGAARDVFRAILETCANPGRIVQMTVPSDAHGPALVWPVLALADIEVVIAVEGANNDADVAASTLEARLARATGARRAASLADADMVVMPNGPTAETLAACRVGSAEQPEQAARVVAACTSIGSRSHDEVGASVWVVGPGAAQGRLIELGGVEPSAIEQLSRINAEYPAGIDVLFVASDGALASVPRSCRVEVVAEAS